MTKKRKSSELKAAAFEGLKKHKQYSGELKAAFEGLNKHTDTILRCLDEMGCVDEPFSSEDETFSSEMNAAAMKELRKLDGLTEKECLEGLDAAMVEIKKHKDAILGCLDDMLDLGGFSERCSELKNGVNEVYIEILYAWSEQIRHK